MASNIFQEQNSMCQMFVFAISYFYLFSLLPVRRTKYFLTKSKRNCLQKVYKLTREANFFFMILGVVFSSLYNV